MTLNWFEVMSGTVHDVRAHIRQATTHSQLLQRDLEPQTSPESTVHLDAVLDSLKRLDHLARRLGILSQAAAYTRTALWMDQQQLETLVLAVALEKEPAIKECGGKLQTTHGANLGVPAKLQIALSELVQNSIVFRDPSRPLEVEVRTGRANGRIQVHVIDNGSGWTEGQADRMFEPFFRLCADRSGNGLGLAIAKLCVEAAGGTIHASLLSQGSEFRIELPAA